MPTIWILIASTGDQRYLAETLDSINLVRGYYPNYNILTVISLHSTSDNLQQVYYNTQNVITYYQPQPLSQFQHYNFLVNQLSIADNDRVIVCDDDDLLLPNALDNIFTYSSWIGLHILAEDKLTSDLLSVWKEDRSLFESIISNIYPERIAEDLTGTTSNGRDIKEYFNQRKGKFIIAMLEDTNYMTYIESLPHIIKLSTPIVIHRIKDNPSLWLQRLTNPSSVPEICNTE